jgi:hypothetical protein
VSISSTCCGNGSWLRKRWRSKWPRFNSSTSRLSRGGVFKRVKIEMARGTAVSVDGRYSVGIADHEFERTAISDQAWGAPFLRGSFGNSRINAGLLTWNSGGALETPSERCAKNPVHVATRALQLRAPTGQGKGEDDRKRLACPSFASNELRENRKSAFASLEANNGVIVSAPYRRSL